MEDAAYNGILSVDYTMVSPGMLGVFSIAEAVADHSTRATPRAPPLHPCALAPLHPCASITLNPWAGVCVGLGFHNVGVYMQSILVSERVSRRNSRIRGS